MPTKKTPPTRDQLAALSTTLKDKPATSNDAQAALWASIGRVDGWAAMTEAERNEYRAKHNALA